MIYVTDLEIGKKIKWLGEDIDDEVVLVIVDLMVLGKSYTYGRDIPSEYCPYLMVIFNNNTRLSWKDVKHAYECSF
jgi:hypothetical protein